MPISARGYYIYYISYPIAKTVCENLQTTACSLEQSN